MRCFRLQRHSASKAILLYVFGGSKDSGGAAKICVSVTGDILQTAWDKWHGTRSKLVDHLLRQFVGSEAAT